jgi:hypothetical protein
MAEEKNKRLAQTRLPGGKVIEREWTPHERYMLFAKGFRAGAGARAIDPACEGLGAYDRGYAEGLEARRKAVDAYAKEIGYVPSILRARSPSSGVRSSRASSPLSSPTSAPRTVRPPRPA